MTPVADFSLLPMALAMPKSASFTSPSLADQHVLRRDVAVHDAQRLPVALARVDVGEASTQRADDGRAPAGSAASAWPSAPAAGPAPGSSRRRTPAPGRTGPPTCPRSSTCTRLLWFSVDAMCASSTNMRTKLRIRGQRRQDPLEHDRLLEALLALLQGQEDLRHAARGRSC